MKKFKNLKMIVCVAKDNLIGGKDPSGNGLLWHVKDELLYFKETTLGHVLLFGANTAKYVPINLMKKNREVFILDFDVDIDKLLEKLESENKTIFICGGYSIYKFFLENYEIEEIYLSVLNENVTIQETDTPLYLPKIENFGYKIKSEKKFNDFTAYVYSK